MALLRTVAGLGLSDMGCAASAAKCATARTTLSSAQASASAWWAGSVRGPRSASSRALVASAQSSACRAVNMPESMQSELSEPRKTARMVFDMRVCALVSTPLGGAHAVRTAASYSSSRASHTKVMRRSSTTSSWTRSPGRTMVGQRRVLVSGVLRSPELTFMSLPGRSTWLG